MPKILSQRTPVAVMRALREHGTAAHELEEPPDIGELLYENDFPEWFVTHSRSQYQFDWMRILPAVRNTQFFFPHTYFGGPGTNITGSGVNVPSNSRGSLDLRAAKSAIQSLN